MNNIAIITARGGSKRIPKKNIKDFCGKPIIAYSIEAAVASGVFSEVMVSTESEEIAEIAKRYGASVPFMRSSKNADDFSTTVDVLQEVLEQYEKYGMQFDALCCIYPTAPFITAEKLQQGAALLDGEEVDSAIPVVPFSFPPQRGFRKSGKYLQYQYPQYELVRSQDLECIYHDCGQFYWVRVETLKRYHSLVTPHTVPMIMREEEVQDIDNFSDWELAELKYQRFIQEKE